MVIWLIYRLKKRSVTDRRTDWLTDICISWAAFAAEKFFTYLTTGDSNGNVLNEGEDFLDNIHTVGHSTSKSNDELKVDNKQTPAYLKVLKGEKLFISSLKTKVMDNSKLSNLLSDTEDYLNSRCDFWSKVWIYQVAVSWFPHHWSRWNCYYLSETMQQTWNSHDTWYRSNVLTLTILAHYQCFKYTIGIK